MSENRKFGQFLTKKTYEICYALFRITSRVERESFARRLEEFGLDLLESVPKGQHKKSFAAIESLDRLVAFGADVGFIHNANADIVRRELGNLNSAIAETANLANAEEVNLTDIFSNELSPVENISEGHIANMQSVGKMENHDKTESFAEVVGGAGLRENDKTSGNGNGTHNIVKTAMRQSAILERIRQNGNCRLKELQEVLPNVSERTIRYDLQRLLEQGAVERIGNGGPATYYRTAESRQ